jgi:hypothetical protein
MQDFEQKALCNAEELAQCITTQIQVLRNLFENGSERTERIEKEYAIINLCDKLQREVGHYIHGFDRED